MEEGGRWRRGGRGMCKVEEVGRWLELLGSSVASSILARRTGLSRMGVYIVCVAQSTDITF